MSLRLVCAWTSEGPAERSGHCWGEDVLGKFIWQFQGDRVTVAAGIRLSTRKVYKVDTLKWKLAGLVNPDAEFDSGNRSGRSRAAGICLETL